MMQTKLTNDYMLWTLHTQNILTGIVIPPHTLKDVETIRWKLNSKKETVTEAVKAE